MKLSKFFVFVGVLFAISVVVYVTTTPRGKDIPLTGIVTGNDVIVASQVAGRMIRLTVDEGSQVHKGDMIAEVDPAEWITARDSAEANIHMLESKVTSAADTRSWTDDQTSASVRQAEATLTSTKSQLVQAQANLWRDQTTYKREQSLFDAGVEPAQSRDLALAAMQASDAAVKSLEDQVKASEAQVAVAQANRKQLDVQQSDLAATRAQLQQARADKATADVHLGYTENFCAARRHRLRARGAARRSDSGGPADRHGPGRGPSLGAGGRGGIVHRSHRPGAADQGAIPFGQHR